MDAKAYLSDCPGDNVFWLCDGRVLKNSVELADALETMNGDVYSYHVNNEKNDFFNWVRDVIADKKLAILLQKAKTKEIAAKEVRDRITKLSSQKAVKTKKPRK